MLMQSQFQYGVTGLVPVLTWLMTLDRSGACTVSESATVPDDPKLLTVAALIGRAKLCSSLAFHKDLF